MPTTNLKQSEGLRQAGCAPSCGFLIRSTDEDEILRATQAHVKAWHHMELSEAQTRASIGDAPK